MPTRREALAALASAAALPLVTSGAARRHSPPCPADADALKLLDEIADELLTLRRRARPRSGSTPARGRRCDRSSPIARRTDSSASRDAGPRRSRRASRRSTPAGSRMRRAPASRSCEAPTRRRSKASRCRTATSPSAAGATRRTSSFRTSAPISTSRASSTATIAIENAADAEAYLARLQSYAKQLDGELGRMQAARGAGLVPPAFLIDKALAQMRALGEERARGRLARRIDRAADEEHPRQLGRARAHDRRAGGRAGARAADRRARRRSAPSRRTMPACRRGRTARSSIAGRSRRRPRRRMSPDEVHEMGQSELERLHARDGRDPEGDRLHDRARVGERMKALAKDPTLQVLRRRQGPRRDHGVHPGAPRRGSARRCRARSTRSSIRTWK